MALFHVHASPIKKVKASGAAGFARYLLEGVACRDGQHLTRAERQRTDLVASGSAHLPRWAKDGEHFWTMANRYERGGPRRPGTVALCYQFSLPRELSAQGRLQLAEDLCTAFFDRYPLTYAIHNPHTTHGDDQPHLHVMFSTRREDTPSARGPETWFNQAAPAGQYRLGAGVKKDHAWFHRLEYVRGATAILTNAALEREGLPYAVTALSLKARGIDRATAPYDPVAENAWNMQAWQTMKQRQALDIERQAILDRVRDTFWVTDTSLYRMQQREASWERSRARAREVETLRPASETFEARRIRRHLVQGHQAHAALLMGHGLTMHLWQDEDEERHRMGYRP